MTRKNADKVLIIDDENSIRLVLKEWLEDEGYEVFLAKDGAEGLRKLRECTPQVALLDVWMPGDLDGIDVLKQAKSENLQTEFIVMSGHGNIETAVKATKLGAWDFVEKPLSIERVLITLKNILNYQIEKGEKNVLLNRLRKDIAMVGNSSALVALKQMIARIAASHSWVLITGENGTGKELVAHNIHYLSPRAGKPFVEVNCAAIPEDLIESELFGYEKGAFTGAVRGKKGKFDLADGGTLFLDEIGDMSLKTQAKILRILQEQRFERLGGEESVEVDVRIVAATNKNLEQEMKEGRFREDLYYRLNVVPLHMPALRDRGDDVPALVSHFSQAVSRQGTYRQKVFSEAAMSRLQNHSWPGNVRELKNFIERIYILTPGDFVDVHDLEFAGLSAATAADGGGGEQTISTFKEARAHFEREFLLRKISENNGNISKTAEKIGLERSYLHRKIKSYGLDLG